MHSMMVFSTDTITASEFTWWGRREWQDQAAAREPHFLEKNKQTKPPVSRACWHQLTHTQVTINNRKNTVKTNPGWKTQPWTTLCFVFRWHLWFAEVFKKHDVPLGGQQKAVWGKWSSPSSTNPLGQHLHDPVPSTCLVLYSPGSLSHFCSVTIFLHDSEHSVVYGSGWNKWGPVSAPTGANCCVWRDWIQKLEMKRRLGRGGQRKHMASTWGEAKLVRSLELGSTWSALADARETLWPGFAHGGCSAKLTGQGLAASGQVAALFAPGMFWRAKMGWDLWAVLRGWCSSGCCCVSKEHCVFLIVWFVAEFSPSLPFHPVSCAKSCTNPASLSVSVHLGRRGSLGLNWWEWLLSILASPPQTLAWDQALSMFSFMFLRSYWITPASPWAICVMHPSLTWHPHLPIGHQNPAPWMYKAYFQNQDNNDVLLHKHLLHG